MSKIPGIKITSPDGNSRKTDIFNMDTGDKITNVTGIRIEATRHGVEVVLTAVVPFEYEGPARIEMQRADGTLYTQEYEEDV